MLNCYYDTMLSAVPNYQPMKVEIISSSHGIALVHDILSKRTIEEIKSKSKPKVCLYKNVR